MVTKCSNTNYQMITKEQYKDLKEYWDYQRKIAYNKEMVFMMANNFEGRVYNDFGMVNIDEMKDLLWTRVRPTGIIMAVTVCSPIKEDRIAEMLTKPNTIHQVLFPVNFMMPKARRESNP